MSHHNKPLFWILLCSGILLFIVLLLQPLALWKFQEQLPILFPKGEIAWAQLDLLLILQLLMLLVILPVYLFTYLFSWWYRADNPQKNYDPLFVDSTMAEVVWWGIPTIMTLLIAGLTWVKTYELDPFRPLVSEKKPLTIQVVALQWKWLFIYPEEKIASVNAIHIPIQTPIHFEITADAPMNSFWIPHLGGQIYAMPNMKTELYLTANEQGIFRGASANLSGEGFAHMNFTVTAAEEAAYQAWVEQVKTSSQPLDFNQYKQMALPSILKEPIFYRLQGEALFDQILMQYMHPPSAS